MNENNLPQSELDMALIALLNALREYNNALQLANRETSILVAQLTKQLENELTSESDRSAADYASGPKSEDQEI